MRRRLVILIAHRKDRAARTSPSWESCGSSKCLTSDVLTITFDSEHQREQTKGILRAPLNEDVSVKKKVHRSFEQRRLRCYRMQPV